MIGAKFAGPADAFTRRLARRAAFLAQVRAENRMRAARGDEWRWRDPASLWPQFTMASTKRR